MYHSINIDLYYNTAVVAYTCNSLFINICGCIYVFVGLCKKKSHLLTHKTFDNINKCLVLFKFILSVLKDKEVELITLSVIFLLPTKLFILLSFIKNKSQFQSTR